LDDTAEFVHRYGAVYMGELHGDYHTSQTSFILIAGRPVLIKDEDFDTPLPAVDLVWIPLSPQHQFILTLYRKRIVSLGHRHPPVTLTSLILLCQDELQVTSVLWQVYVCDLLASILTNQK
jgi:hypothetical protein